MSNTKKFHKEFHKEFHEGMHEGEWASKTLLTALRNTPICVCCGDKTKLFKVLYRYRCTDCHIEEHFEYTDESLEEAEEDAYDRERWLFEPFD